MKRPTATHTIVDLGVASRETKGGSLGVIDTAGRQPGFGLSDD